jgi:hypothetical protein
MNKNMNFSILIYDKNNLEPERVIFEYEFKLKKWYFITINHFLENEIHCFNLFVNGFFICKGNFERNINYPKKKMFLIYLI